MGYPSSAFSIELVNEECTSKADGIIVESYWRKYAIISIIPRSIWIPRTFRIWRFQRNWH